MSIILYDDDFNSYPTRGQAISDQYASYVLNPDIKLVKITYMVEDLDN